MSQLTESELEELILGIDISTTTHPREGSLKHPSTGSEALTYQNNQKEPKKGFFLKPNGLLMLGMGLIMGFGLNFLFIAPKMDQLGYQLELLINRLDQYDSELSPPSVEVIEPFEATLPPDGLA
jgi:hypothetical protein